MAATPLNSHTSLSLVLVIKQLIEDAQNIGAMGYVAIFNEMIALAETIAKDPSDEHADEAADILRECIVCIQTSLFSFALTGDTKQDHKVFTNLIELIKDFDTRIDPDGILKQKTLPSTKKDTGPAFTSQKPQATPKTAPIDNPSHSGTQTMQVYLPTASPVDKMELGAEPVADTPIRTSTAQSPQDTKEKIFKYLSEKISDFSTNLLSTISSLCEKGWGYPELRPLLISLSKETEKNSCQSFQDLCEKISNELNLSIRVMTPWVALETGLVPLIVRQLHSWLEEVQPDQSEWVISLRPIGRTLMLELDSLDMVTGESFSSNSKQFKSTLPLFEGYLAKWKNKTVIIPSVDVVMESQSNIVKNIPRISLARLFSPNDRHEITAVNSAKEQLLVSWKNSKVLLEADSFQGPTYFIFKPIPSLGGKSSNSPPELIGFANFDDRQVGLIIDLHIWFNKEFKPKSHKAELIQLNENKSTEKIESKQLLFSFESEIFSIPASIVLEVGELNRKHISHGFLEAEKGIYCLQDLKDFLGLGKSRGQKFVAFQTDQGPIAIVIDKLIHFFEIDPSSFEPVFDRDQNRSESSKWLSFVKGSIPLPPALKEKMKNSHFYILDFEAIFKDTFTSLDSTG